MPKQDKDGRKNFSIHGVLTGIRTCDHNARVVCVHMRLNYLQLSGKFVYHLLGLKSSAFCPWIVIMDFVRFSVYKAENFLSLSAGNWRVNNDVSNLKTACDNVLCSQVYRTSQEW
jgi:hypothetical protein